MSVNLEELRIDCHGETIAAWQARPVDANGPVPCVVMGHGFSATRHDSLRPFIEAFADAGYGVLCFDYRYFGDSSGEPRQLADIASQQDDYRTVISYGRSLDWIDSERIVLFGSSFSGGHVVEIAAEDHRIAAVIAQSPFTDGRLQLKSAKPLTLVRGIVDGVIDSVGARLGRPPRMVRVAGPPGSYSLMNSPEAEPGFNRMVADGSPWRNEVAARIVLKTGSWRPILRAPRIECPLLVAICDNDQTTPPEAAERLALAAPLGEFRHYPIGHFELYWGEGFSAIVADEIEFLGRTVAPGLAVDA